MRYSYTMSIWVSNSSSKRITRAENGLLTMSYSYMSCLLWVGHILWAYGWATHRLTEFLALKMRCLLWVTHYELLIHHEQMGELINIVAHYELLLHELLIISYLNTMNIRVSNSSSKWVTCTQTFLIMSHSYMSCSLWVTNILRAFGWATHRLAELLALKMLCSFWITHFELFIHELLIISYSYTISIWVSNSSSNWVTRAQNGLLILSYSLWVTHTWVAHYELLIHYELMGEQLTE